MLINMSAKRRSNVEALPQERRGRRVSSDGLMVQPMTWCWPSGGDYDRWHWQHGVDCQQGTTVLCRESNETPTHTAGIEFSVKHAASGVYRVTGWCVSTWMCCVVYSHNDLMLWNHLCNVCNNRATGVHVFEVDRTFYSVYCCLYFHNVFNLASELLILLFICDTLQNSV